jgi:predicted nucleic acid-binding protein
MQLLLDSSLWIDFTRSRSPVELKQRIAPWVLDPQACLAEPVRFELLRSARPNELVQLEALLSTVHCLSTPVQLWDQAAELGRRCQGIGRTVSSLDLLVAAVAMHHQAMVVTFDADFEAIAGVSSLQIERLQRPR